MPNDPQFPGLDDAQKTVEVVDLIRRHGHQRRAWVEVVRGPDAGTRANIAVRRFRIGSDPLSDLALSDPTTSRRHCEIRVSPQGYLLQDVGSTNGTFVDELRLGEIFLDNGALIKVGETLLRFGIESTGDEAATDVALGVDLKGRSAAIRAVANQILKVAPTDLSVVIEGETGTGKELVARAIHANSRRSDQPIIVFDCSAFPASLIESELFGHERGAFSGAVGVHKGVFERADGGSIFFDELGEMEVEFQAKFLRALESGEIRRVGGERTFNVDVRVIAATNRNLEEMVEAGTFRQDLFYRLAKMRLEVPPLRDRIEDVPVLSQFFLTLHSIPGQPTPTITPEALDVLCAYPWPGNVRELRNHIERAAALSEGGRITAEYLLRELGLTERMALERPTDPQPLEPHADLLPDEKDGTVPLRDAKERIISDFERRYLKRLLEKHKQNVSRAAREAQVDRRHFYRLLKKYNLMDSPSDDT